MNLKLANHGWLPEPMLAFSAEGTSKQARHPLKGLCDNGPYSAGLVLDPIRIATISPARESDTLYEFMKRLRRRWKPSERPDYLPVWPGFREVFELDMQAAGSSCHIRLEDRVDADVQMSDAPHVVLAEHIVRALQTLSGHRTQFDLVFIYVPERWQPGFAGGAGDDFDLHDHIKAFTAGAGIPVQLVREGRAISYDCQASVMWRIGLAIYAKAGGVPWKLAEADPETAYIGISYSVRGAESELPRFVTCCSQVFDSDGAGLEFVAYDAREVDVQQDNPFLSQSEMFRVMTRSMDLYRRRHAGRSPRRVMVHKSTEFKREERDGCMEALRVCEGVDLVQVVEHVDWRGVRIDGRGKGKGSPAAFPVPRGTVLPVGDREALLWNHGDVRGVTSRSYFQGSRSTPRPLRLIRHAGHGSWDDTAQAILGLSKMNWNNDALYDQLPVTMSYAKVLSRVVKRIPQLRREPYQFRFFM